MQPGYSGISVPDDMINRARFLIEHFPEAGFRNPSEMIIQGFRDKLDSLEAQLARRLDILERVKAESRHDLRESGVEHSPRTPKNGKK